MIQLRALPLLSAAFITFASILPNTASAAQFGDVIVALVAPDDVYRAPGQELGPTRLVAVNRTQADITVNLIGRLIRVGGGGNATVQVFINVLLEPQAPNVENFTFEVPANLATGDYRLQFVAREFGVGTLLGRRGFTVVLGGEELCDGVDNDGDGLVDEDIDACGLLGTIDLSTADARWTGEASDSYGGRVVASAGDVDGDGYDDLLVGANLHDGVGADSGAAYLIYGPVTGDESLADADAIFDGEAAGDWAGRAVASAGDVDDDGYDDILISAILNDEGGNNAGATYLFYGPVYGRMSLAAADAKLIGEASGDYSGRSVDSAGDANGDGYDDILIGAHLNDAGATSAGATYLVHGPVYGDVDLANADARFIGEAAGDHVGRPMSSAGDVNADGIQDFLIGAHFEASVGYRSGAVYLLYGPMSGDIDLSTAHTKFVGEAEGDMAGSWVAAAGDVDGDGFDDILIGADGESSAGAEAGAAYLLYGPFGPGTFGLGAAADVKLTGEAAGDHAGWSVAGAGDVDNDGYDDILVGAYLQDGGGTDSGAGYLLYGPIDGDLSLGDADVKFVGESAGDSAGCFVSSAGDQDGDGYDDIAIGAFGVSNDTGAAYVIYGMGQ
jgi:hypothetical protein